MRCITEQDRWWNKAAVYQIYPRSFQDSNGDGIGDIPGIISRLDYIRELGFTALWISPFFESPQADFGYDISDYRTVAPEYGTMEDCLLLIEESHKRNLKILFDLVLNHTSERHPWFVESRSSRINPKRDYYVWRDGRLPGGKAPPNNWRSKVSGSGWHYDSCTDQWYWAAFLPFQPDLNYRNPEVRRVMLDNVSFWLDKGVDGFRLDIIGNLFEDREFRDNPFSRHFLPTEENQGMFFRSTCRTENLPETFEFVRELRKVSDRYTDPPRYLVGEVFGPSRELRRYCGEGENPGLHSVFLFRTLSTPFTARSFRSLIDEFEKNFPGDTLPTLVFSNHDVMRRFSALGNSPRRARLSAFLQFTLRGIPFTYYGEEIGMRERFFPFSRTLDPVASRFAFLPVPLQRLLQRLMNGRISRDGCRTPMQWTGTAPGHGFTALDAEPWLPFAKDAESVTVEAGQVEPESLLSLYRLLLSLRSAYDQLTVGACALFRGKGIVKTVLSFDRFLPGKPVLRVFANMTGSWRSVRCGPAAILASTHGRQTQSDRLIRLAPWEGVLAELPDTPS